MSKILLETVINDDIGHQKLDGEVVSAFKIQFDEAMNSKLKELGYATPEEHEALQAQVSELVEALVSAAKTIGFLDSSLYHSPSPDTKKELEKIKTLVSKHNKGGA